MSQQADESCLLTLLSACTHKKIIQFYWIWIFAENQLVSIYVAVHKWFRDLYVQFIAGTFMRKHCVHITLDPPSLLFQPIHGSSQNNNYFC